MPSVMIMGKNSLLTNLNHLENKVSLFAANVQGDSLISGVAEVFNVLEPFALSQPMTPGYKFLLVSTPYTAF